MELFAAGSKSQMKESYKNIAEIYASYKEKKYHFDMSRGKPCPEQLDLSNGLMTCLGEKEYFSVQGTDCRNYGNPEGIAEARELFAEMLEVKPEEVIIGGNSSLNMMYDTMIRAMQCGVEEGGKPWRLGKEVKFLCPSPGYDRHFAICESMGIRMITVAMTDKGPDMEAVERMAAADPAVKGIWCVPLYSNPDGISYSDETVARLASMKTKAQDFRIFWDNAYAVHHLDPDEPDKVKNILPACREAGNEDRPYIFSSTSKITFPGAGIAMMAASSKNISFIMKHLTKQTIGPDKLNQLRHVKFLGGMDGIKLQMAKHAAILRPKFDAVLDIFDKELHDNSIATWNKPRGGYFISLNVAGGCAGRAVRLAKDAGVILTPAGATFPYGKDPADSNIRIAPTFPPLAELPEAIRIVCACVKLACAEKMAGICR